MYSKLNKCISIKFWPCLFLRHISDAPSTRDVSLAYGLTMLGDFVTGDGSNLTAECRNLYTEDFLFATITQSTRVNGEIGVTLCAGVDISIDGSSVTLNSYQSQVRQRRHRQLVLVFMRLIF